jgi:hypothetical protein
LLLILLCAATVVVLLLLLLVLQLLLLLVLQLLLLLLLVLQLFSRCSKRNYIILWYFYIYISDINQFIYIGFEVLAAVDVKSSSFWGQAESALFLSWFLAWFILPP